MSHIEYLRSKVQDVEVVDELSQEMIWEKHGAVIWQANKFIGKPCFYPVYRWKNFYSYSILALILKKNSLDINSKAVELVNADDFQVLSANTTIDNEISRVGQAHHCGYSISNVDEYSSKIVEALIKDTVHLEKLHKGYVNLIMCGGKDSLNLLLLPWENPVVALSAEPNYDLVCEFVEKNSLDIQVRKLEDTYNDEHLEDEIAENCCRVDLAHWRWGIHLREIVQEYDGKVVIWKGQVGDLYMSDTWKTYMYPSNPVEMFIRKVYKKTSFLLPRYVNEKIGKFLQPSIIKATWDKSANLQGCHMGFIRSLSDCLVLSAYHGPHMVSVLSEAHLGAVAQHDIRPKIGKLLLGRDIIYPVSNPAPKISGFRLNKHKTELFVSSLKSAEVPTQS